MTSIWIAIAFACFVWWFSTGAILFVVKSADNGTTRAHWNATIAGVPLLVIGLFGLYSTTSDASVLGVYLAFLSAIAVWGWFELAFLCGVVTGPMPKPCPPGVGGLERFIRGWGAVAYSEIALVVIGLLIFLWTEDAANYFGLGTYLTLLFARVSAKLNLYMGVANINTDFLPNPVRHLASHFRSAKMNWLFPISITLLAFTIGYWVELIIHTEGAAKLVGYTLLATLTALALVEHWLMMLPLPDAKLWQWMLPQNKAVVPRND